MFSQLELFLEKRKNNAFAVIIAYWVAGIFLNIIITIIGELFDHTIFLILSTITVTLIMLLLEFATGYTIYYLMVKRNTYMSVNKFLLFGTLYFAVYYVSEIILSLFNMSFTFQLFGPIGAIASIYDFVGIETYMVAISEAMVYLTNFSYYQSTYGFFYPILAIMMDITFFIAGASRIAQIIIYHKDMKRNNL